MSKTLKTLANNQGSWVIPFGKHIGLTVASLAKSNPGYLTWLAKDAKEFFRYYDQTQAECLIAEVNHFVELINTERSAASAKITEANKSLYRPALANARYRNINLEFVSYRPSKFSDCITLKDDLGNFYNYFGFGINGVENKSITPGTVYTASVTVVGNREYQGIVYNTVKRPMFTLNVGRCMAK
jgi:hypothetical protein